MSTASPRRRRPLQVALGIVLVILAFVGVLVVGRFAGAPVQKITIVSAAHDIHVGKKIAADDLSTVDVDAPGPTGGFRDRTAPVGKVARQNIAAGALVLDTQLAAETAATPARLFFTLPPGKVALNIPAGDISPYVQPGDQIDVIATPKSASTAANQQTKSTLKGLLVLAVGAPGAASGGNTTTTGGNLVVQVSLQDAEALQFIVKNTDFTYVLKSPQDAGGADPSTTGVDLNTFKSTFGFR
ncbi:MAG: Flp pilus assembly protein CpaB [Candidatus Dormibacteraeota bacterium]|nr:Flp pilus assembly protein CpaB [Candidatus Dormibacteraeota bacterium]